MCKCNQNSPSKSHSLKCRFLTGKVLRKAAEIYVAAQPGKNFEGHYVVLHSLSISAPRGPGPAPEAPGCTFWRGLPNE